MRILNKMCLSLTLVSACMANAAPLDPFEKLIAEVANRSVFQQVTTESRCPKFITPIESEPLPYWAKAGDRSIYLSSPVDAGEFTHKENSIFYRPGLTQGKTHLLKRSLGYPIGISSSVSKQTVKDGVLISEYSAKLGPVGIIASAKYKLQYDANSDTIQYHFSGTWFEDVDCTFNKVN